jgi:hypothetical protein
MSFVIACLLLKSAISTSGKIVLAPLRENTKLKMYKHLSQNDLFPVDKSYKKPMFHVQEL